MADMNSPLSFHAELLESDAPMSSDLPRMRDVPAPSSGLARSALTLETAFQPIFSVAHGSAVGHEALLRASDGGRNLGAGEALTSLARVWSTEKVEEACIRQHLSAFARSGRDGWVFVNVSPSVLASREGVESRFGAWLDEAGLPGARVVIELIETQAASEVELARAVDGFRDQGCKIAIDDFGAGQSNFERIWRIRPDIVKLDREMLVEATKHEHVRGLVPGIVSLLHEAGCLVVLEGIEDHEQALIAMESDVDFVQGYLLSRPTSLPHDEIAAKETLGVLSVDLRARMTRRRKEDDAFFAFYTGAFQQCARALEGNVALARAAEALLALAGVQRVYLLDAEGRQVGDNYENQLGFGEDTMAFGPFVRSGGADWSRRPYFQRAIARPAALQISRPYLSVRDARRCVTFSMALEVRGETRVLCADLDLAAPTQRRTSALRRV